MHVLNFIANSAIDEFTAGKVKWTYNDVCGDRSLNGVFNEIL